MTRRFTSSGHWAALACALIVAGLIAGCGPSAGEQQMQSNEDMLRGMIASDHQQIEALQEQVGHLSDQMTELQHNGEGGAPGKNVAQLQQEVSKLESQVASLQSTPGAAAPGSPAAGASPGSPEGTGAAVGGSPPALPLPGSEVPPAGPPSPGAAAAPTWQSLLDQELAARYDDPGAELYRTGLNDMKDGKYAPALAKFQDLQRRYPKSDLSEPSEFFAASALYETGKYDQSILQYNDLTMRFPNGRFASPALLREAQAFMKVNDSIDARLTLQKLVNDHPNSPEAASARSMLQSMAPG